MRGARLGLVLSLLALVALMASPALADHCGAEATMTPSAGPVGTSFVFRTNLGEPSDLYLYRNGNLVKTAHLDESDFVAYAIPTRAGDNGSWRARAEVRGSPDCAAEASFTVGAAPDTSTGPSSSPAGSGGLPFLVIWAAALVAARVRLRVATRG